VQNWFYSLYWHTLLYTVNGNLVLSTEVRSTDCHSVLTNLYVILHLRTEYKMLSTLKRSHHLPSVQVQVSNMPIHRAELKVLSERVQNYSIYCFFMLIMQQQNCDSNERVHCRMQVLKRVHFRQNCHFGHLICISWDETTYKAMSLTKPVLSFSTK
jgi:hypothetical protein